MEQRTDEWSKARCGLFTASRFADLLAKTKTGVSASRSNYIAQILCERLTGKVSESYMNQAMMIGTEREPLARALYEAHTGVLVDEVGFIKHLDLPCGASPDGLIGNDGGIEIKCPQPAAHLEYLLVHRRIGGLETCQKRASWRAPRSPPNRRLRKTTSSTFLPASCSPPHRRLRKRLTASSIE